MKLKSLLILFAICVGLGVYLYLGVQKPAEEKESPDYGRLAQGQLLDVMEVTVKTKESEFSLKKENGQWMIVSPVKDIASESKVSDLIAALKRFKETRVLFNEEDLKKEQPDLAQFGLKDPRITLTYKDPTLDSPFVIKVGSLNPGKSSVYAQTSKNLAIYLASLDLDYLASQRAEDFREMKLTTIRNENFSDFSLSAKGKESKFKLEDGKWIMTSPYQLPVDSEVIRQLVEKVSLIRANRFLEKEPAELKTDTRVIVGFKEGISDARVKAGDQRPFGLEIRLGRHDTKKQQAKGQESATFYAKGDKTPWAQISQFHYDNLQKSPEDFLKKTFDDFELADIQQVKVKVPGSVEVQLERSSDGWTASTSKESKPGNKVNIEQSLQDLRTMRALRFLELSPPPSVASLTVTLTLKDQTTRRFVFDLKKDIGTLYTKLGGKEAEFVTSPDIVKVDKWKWSFLTQEAVQIPPQPTTNSEVKSPKSE